MKRIILILGNQLSLDNSAFEGVDKNNDLIVMIEAWEEFSYPRHHKQKIVLIISAMRHFAAILLEKGFRLKYFHLNDHGESGSLLEELYKAVKEHQAERLVVTEPGEYRLWEDMLSWESKLGVKVEIRVDDYFLCSKEQFADWARGRKSLRMENFYRMMRRRSGFLIDGSKPAGGKWNYDYQNRKISPRGIRFTDPLRFSPDGLTLDVIRMVENIFGDHFGTTSYFNWAVTREDALKALAHFVENNLLFFGDYQDIMRTGHAYIFHAVLSPYINLGLLKPVEVCQAVEKAYRSGLVPINCAEGFLRQVLGWREYVRGVYWLKMPGYRESNYLNAQRPLPEFFWTGETDLKCMAEVIGETYRNAYAHHIQRLMITGNFALLAGLRPAEVEEWYLIVYADAFEWVELPNTHGMALYADGGLLASKPYAASAAYINRMSDYCKHCFYRPEEKTGLKACPFNYLYWNFLIKNKALLKTNPRMSLVYQMLDRMPEDQRLRIQKDAGLFLESLASSEAH